MDKCPQAILLGVTGHWVTGSLAVVVVKICSRLNIDSMQLNVVDCKLPREKSTSTCRPTHGIHRPLRELQFRLFLYTRNTSSEKEKKQVISVAIVLGIFEMMKIALGLFFRASLITDWIISGSRAVVVGKRCFDSILLNEVDCKLLQEMSTGILIYESLTRVNQKLPFGSEDYLDKLFFHQALN